MTSLFFIILSNFITCSFARNFTVFELLKKPIVFKGVRQESFYVFDVPKGIPIDETILVIGNSFTSKLKDLALKKGVKEKDKNNDYVVVEATVLESYVNFDKTLHIDSVSLVYSPWYRFVSEPFRIGDVDLINDHIMGVFSYGLRSQNVLSKLRRNSMSETALILESNYYGFDKVTVYHHSTLEKIQLEGSKGCSILDLTNKTIMLSRGHDELLFSALNKVENGALQNISITKNKNTIELAYEK